MAIYENIVNNLISKLQQTGKTYSFQEVQDYVNNRTKYSDLEIYAKKYIAKYIYQAMFNNTIVLTRKNIRQLLPTMQKGDVAIMDTNFDFYNPDERDYGFVVINDCYLEDKFLSHNEMLEEYNDDNNTDFWRFYHDDEEIVHIKKKLENDKLAFGYTFLTSVGKCGIIDACTVVNYDVTVLANFIKDYGYAMVFVVDEADGDKVKRIASLKRRNRNEYSTKRNCRIIRRC